MRLRTNVTILVAVGLTSGLAGIARAQAGFVQIDVPGSLFTTATGVNNLNDVVGWYTTNSSSGTGFEYDAGSFINLNISVPAAGTGISSPFTQPLAINDTGSIVGVFGGVASGQAVSSGFLINSSGAIQISPPNAIESEATAIDDNGDIAGWFVNGQSQTEGFILGAASSTYTPVSVPGASATEITGIDNNGDVVGIADLSTGEAGFLYDYGAASPQFFAFSLPVALAISAMSINDLGEIACTYTDVNGGLDGCVSNRWTFSTVDDPNGIGTTSITGINDEDLLAGSFVDSNGTMHGLLVTPEPSSAVLLGTALLLLGLMVAGRRFSSGARRHPASG
ncbi:MAG: hypothetical protein ACRD11_17195 [Terriglobia bacterium]